MSVTSQGKPLKPGSHTDKAVGCILAALCGDALGAAVEGWTAYRVQKDFPNGLTHFQECRMGRGCYTGVLDRCTL
jgi:ADP-ribosylglycohydrolase